MVITYFGPIWHHPTMLIRSQIGSKNKKYESSKLARGASYREFRAILKRDVYMDGWTADNVDKLESRIRYCLRKIDVKAVQESVATTYKRLDQIRRFGVK